MRPKSVISTILIKYNFKRKEKKIILEPDKKSPRYSKANSIWNNFWIKESLKKEKVLISFFLLPALRASATITKA